MYLLSEVFVDYLRECYRRGGGFWYGYNHGYGSGFVVGRSGHGGEYGYNLTYGVSPSRAAYVYPAPHNLTPEHKLFLTATQVAQQPF